MSYGFLHGTEIETGYGTRRIERLTPGDRVLTLAGKLVPINWIGQTILSAREAARAPQMRPLRVPPGSLSEHGPSRDLIVSPLQEVLLSTGPGGAESRLVQAKELPTHLDRLPVLLDMRFTHLMLEQDGLMLANGIWCQSMAEDHLRDSGTYETQMQKIRLAG